MTAAARVIQRPAARAIVYAFASVARPVLTMGMQRNNCIASTRVTIDVLDAFGLTATPLVCEAWLYSPALSAMAERLGRWPTGEEAAADPGSWMVGVGSVLNEDDVVVDGWRAHMVASVDMQDGGVPWLIDASLDQGNRPDYGIEVPGVIVGRLQGLPMWGTCANGTTVAYSEHPNPPAYEHAPDWRPMRYAWEVAVITDLMVQRLIDATAKEMP